MVWVMRISSFYALRYGAVLGLLLAVAAWCPAGPSPPSQVKNGAPRADSTTAPDVDTRGGSSERIDRLIRQLGDDQFAKREEAQGELAKLGFAAFEALRAAANDSDLEIATRARYLLRLMSTDLTRPGDPPEVASLLAEFHLLEERGQVARLEKLAALEDGQGIAALCRVIRFEPSIVLAKQAALILAKRYPSKQVAMDRLAKLLRENLQGSRRLPSRWMLSYAKFHDAPDDAWREWDQWTREEMELARQNDQGTSSRIVSDLAAQQVDWAVRMGGTPAQMVDKIQVLFELYGRRDRNAGALVAWLVEQKAWEALGVRPLAFVKRLALEPRSFVYDLAKKYAEMGKTALAETAAQRAFQWEDGSPSEGQRLRIVLALQLQEQGYFRWAEREYRHVMGSGSLNDPFVVDAYDGLAAMLHDQSENLRAAEVLQQLATAMKEEGDAPKKAGMSALAADLSKQIMARMNYYRACHWRDAGDRQKQRLSLEAGLAHDPTSPDLLIAAFNLPDTDPVFRSRVRKLLAEASFQMRKRVLTGPDRAIACNDLAWLIANTEGDFDEAIRLSRRSLAEQPDNGAYYDTLARCHFAKGDYAGAVKHQIKAAELEPNSGLIIKQLDLFRRTYEEKLGKPAPKPGPPKKKNLGPRLINGSIPPVLEIEGFAPRVRPTRAAKESLNS